MRSDFDFAMQNLGKQTVKRARDEYGVDLDFSPESIQRVEEILGKLHEKHLQTPLTEEELLRMALRWGAYIGEVMKRVRPGKWQRDSELAGAGTTPVVFGPGNEAFPRAWAYKRIADGQEDNVAFKFKFFLDQRSGMDTAESPKTSQ